MKVWIAGPAGEATEIGGICLKTGKKMIALALAAVLTVSAAGCVTEDPFDMNSAGGKTTSNAADKPGKQDNARTGYDGTTPIYKDTFEISVLLPGTQQAAAPQNAAETSGAESGAESGEAGAEGTETEPVMPGWIREIEEKANVKLDLEFTDTAFYADETAKRRAAGTDLPTG